MNNKALTLSVVMAAFAVFFVQSYVESIEEEAKEKFGTEVLVVTAKQDIKEMATINETMLELTPVPKRFLEPAAISFTTNKQDEAVVKNMKKLAGTVAVVPVKKGEQITYNKLTAPSLRTGLAPQVTPGRRAVALAVNEVSGVAKLVKPGDRVDIIAVLDVAGARDSKLVKTILQDVVVLAVGRNVTNNIPRLIERDPSSNQTKIRSLTQYDGFASVTIEVDPAQAQGLALITSDRNAVLTLSLRNNDDTDRTSLSGMTIWDILGSDAQRAKALRQPPAARGRQK